MAKVRKHKWTISAPIGTRIVGAEISGNGRRIKISSETQATDFFASDDNQDKDFRKYPGEGIRFEHGFLSCPDSEHPMEGVRLINW